ncbi:MAG: glycerophosphodiester phosphodiesterase family protein, partial [Solirubrobacterales bacterium]
VTKDRTRKRWATLPLAGALVALRQRLPGLAAQKLPLFGVEAMWVYHPLVSPRLARICKLARVELIAWTVDDLPRMRKLVDAGVDGLVSNDPRLFESLKAPD